MMQPIREMPCHAIVMVFFLLWKIDKIQKIFWMQVDKMIVPAFEKFLHASAGSLGQVQKKEYRFLFLG